MRSVCYRERESFGSRCINVFTVWRTPSPVNFSRKQFPSPSDLLRPLERNCPTALHEMEWHKKKKNITNSLFNTKNGRNRKRPCVNQHQYHSPYTFGTTQLNLLSARFSYLKKNLIRYVWNEFTSKMAKREIRTLWPAPQFPHVELRIEFPGSSEKNRPSWPPIWLARENKLGNAGIHHPRNGGGRYIKRIRRTRRNVHYGFAIGIFFFSGPAQVGAARESPPRICCKFAHILLFARRVLRFAINK